jgi:DNA-binding NtrC family response regulator
VTPRRSILIIDDDLGMRETFNWALSAYGFNVSTASSGAKGIALGKAGRFDLMVVDLRLPDLSGIEVIRALQSERPDVRFVLVSAFLTDFVTVEAENLGAIAVWEKPVAVEDVLAIVRAAPA